MPSKYRDVTKNGCPTGWKYAVEKWWMVCKEIHTTFMMRVLAAFWGSFILAIFLVGGSVSFNSNTAAAGDPINATLAFLVVPLLHGIGLFVVAASVLPIGGTGNPSLTIVQGIAGMISYSDMLWFVVAETAGWVLGSLVLRIWTSDALLLASIPALQPGTELFEGFLIELFAAWAWGITLFLYVQKPVQDLQVGLGLTAAMFVAWPFTRGALNMHRVLGPAIALLFTGNTEYWSSDVVVYLFGPLIGFLLAYITHRLSFAATEDKCAKQKCQSQETNCIPAGNYA